MTDENVQKMLDNLTKRVSELEDRERTITDVIREFSETQEKILRFLKGEEFSDHKGIDIRMENVEADVEKLQQFKQKWIYWLSGAAFIGSSLATLIGFLIWNFVINPK